MRVSQVEPGPAREARVWAALAHALPLLVSWVTLGSCAWLAPLAILLAKGREPFVAAHARESLNFRITLALVAALLMVLFAVLFVALGWSLGLDQRQHQEGGMLFFLLVAAVMGLALTKLLPAFAVVWLLELVLVALAARRALRGELFRYPLCLRLVRSSASAPR